MTAVSLPLQGVRVLDFTRVLAGPFATMLLGDMGADVIKIEGPGGDDTRQWGPPWFEGVSGRESAYFLSVNRNKRSLALNLKQPAARDIIRELARDSAICVENFKPGGMAAFGLGYEDLRAIQPALVYASITGYGQSGPYRDRPGYDFVIQAQGGLMSITGPEEGQPYKVGVAITDVIAGLFAALSILAALRAAESSGAGQHLDIALLDTALAALVNVVSGALVSQQTPARYGNAHASIVPYQPFDAADRAFALAVGNDRQFAQLCAMISRPELIADVRFSTNPARVQHRDALIALLGPIFRTRPADEWVADLLALGIPAGPLNTISDVLADPQIQARGLIHDVSLFDSVLQVIGPAVGFSETPAQVRLPPPRVGEHGDEILRDLLGRTDADIARLRADGVLV